MTIYLSEHIDEKAVAYLQQYAEIVDNFDHPEVIDAIILRNIPITADLMDKTVNLKVIGKHGVGVNTIDLEAAKARGIRVFNTPETNADAVAEMVVTLFLSLARDTQRANNNCRKGTYSTIAPADLVGLELGGGKTVGLIGMGHIAQRVAKIVKFGFGARVLGYDPFVDAQEAANRGFEKVEPLEELLEQSDFVSVNVPLLKSTKNMISGQMFDHFKKNAILVNTARGGIVNEADLLDALSSGKLRAAGCDAFVHEPPSPQWYQDIFSFDEFSATPHIGGNTEEALQRTGMEVVSETLNVLRGMEPRHPVV